MWSFGTDEKKKIYNVKEEIIIAAKYYERKYKVYPDTCFLNVNAECDIVIENDEYKINVSKYKWILDKCLMIGTEKETETLERIFLE
jgi:hypothetical protein